MVSSYGGSTEWSLAQEEGFQKVQNEFVYLPYNCVALDKDLKVISEKILSERKKYPFPNLKQKAYIEALESKKMFWEQTFSSKGCRDIIENIRLKTGAVEQSKYAIKAEKEVLPANEKDQSIYIGIGAVVMLVGLYIVLK